MGRSYGICQICHIRPGVKMWSPRRRIDQPFVRERNHCSLECYLGSYYIGMGLIGFLFTFGGVMFMINYSGLSPMFLLGLPLLFGSFKGWEKREEGKLIPKEEWLNSRNIKKSKITPIPYKVSKSPKPSKPITQDSTQNGNTQATSQLSTTVCWYCNDDLEIGIVQCTNCGKSQ